MQEPLRILILEDIEEDAGLIEHWLRKSKIIFSSQRVETRDDFIAALDKFSPDLVLSDHSLPQFNSREALNICKQKNTDIPFILVTGSVSEEFAVECIKLGADDYILKSNLTRLPTAIFNSLKQKEVERNKKVAEQTLLQQNVELTKINQELDRFVYSASHDLRAPLKSVLGLVKLSQEDCTNNKYDLFQEYLQMIENSIVRLDMTIKDIINYSRNARTDVAKELIDPESLIKEVLEDMKYVAGSEEIMTNITIQSHSPFYSDSSRLRVVLNNLISNSIKYRNLKNNSYVNVSVEVTEEKALITIQDNGIGIDPIYINKIFNMFFRATAKSEGSGLGLYIVKETLDKLNGSINVNSVLNEGSTFTIEIPNSLP
jgi:signal transduction histidine kinase